MASERILLPGLAELPERDRIAASRGQLGRIVEAAAVVEVAERTLAAAGEAMAARVRDLLGLAGRDRPRRGPLALRALVLALDDGRLAAHEDLRARLPLAPEQTLGTEAYKYTAFYQESVVATLHARSINQSRWDVHHLFHTTHGLLWRPDMLRGEIYASARINEAACEAHWYWFEGMLGPRCPSHASLDLKAMASSTWPDCKACDDAAAERAPRGEALELARGGLRFWDSEMASIDMLETARVVVPNPLSGAVENWREAFNYLAHHERRLRSRPFQAYVERCLAVGQDYQTSVAALRDATAERLVRLLVAPLEVDVTRTRYRQARRILQDAGARLLQSISLGWLAEARLGRLLDTLGRLTSEASAIQTEIDAARLQAARHEVWEVLLELAREPGARPALALGYDLRAMLGEPPPARIARDGAGAELAQGGLLGPLREALEQALPLTSRAAARHGDDPHALARRVASTPAFAAGRQPLERIAEAALAGDPPLAELARFEQLLAVPDLADRAIREDLYALDAVGEDLDPSARVRLNPTLSEASFEHDVESLARGGPIVKAPTHLWVGSHGGRPVAAVCNELHDLAPALKRPRAIAELIGAGGVLAGRPELLAELIAKRLLIVLAG